jgi:hypothetical protein
VPQSAVQVHLYSAGPGETVVWTSVAEVEVRHNGVWCAAEHTGWLRQWNGSWWPLVCYTADGAMWTRAVRPSCVRQLDADLPAVPAPRVRGEPTRLARLGGGVSSSA